MKAFKLEADMYAGSTRQARQPAAASEGDARWHCSAEVGNNTDARLQTELGAPLHQRCARCSRCTLWGLGTHTISPAVIR